MTGNTFAPAAVALAADLIRRGAPALRSTIHREHPDLTPLGLDRVIDLAGQEIDASKAADAKGVGA